jgi:DNA-binding transcriptional LysR family regulator
VSEGFDAAIRFGEPEPSGLIVRKLLKTRILTCAAPTYLGPPRPAAASARLAAARMPAVFATL